MAIKQKTNENILKLRQLTKLISEIPPTNEYVLAISEIKFIMQDIKTELSKIKTCQAKIKYYDKIYNKIINILNNTK